MAICTKRTALPSFVSYTRASCLKFLESTPIRALVREEDAGTPPHVPAYIEPVSICLGFVPGNNGCTVPFATTICEGELWALNGDLDGHHHGGEHITHYLFTYCFTYNILLPVKILNSNRLEKLPSITIDMDRPGPCSCAPNRLLQIDSTDHMIY